MCLTDDWPGRAREAHLSGPLMPFKTRLTVPFSIETLVEDHEGLLLPLFQVHWSPLALSSYTRRNRVFVLWCRMDVSLSLQSLSSLTRDARCVFIQRVLFAPHIALRLFYTFYCFCFIVYFSADSSGCDVCGLEGGICLQSIYCLFICTGLSHPEVRRPLSLELQSRLWDPPPPPFPETCASIGVSVMPTLYFDFQLFSVRTAVNSTSQVTSVCHHPKGNLASFSFLFSRASSQMYVVLSKHNYALSIKAIQDWVFFFFFKYLWH